MQLASVVDALPAEGRAIVALLLGKGMLYGRCDEETQLRLTGRTRHTD